MDSSLQLSRTIRETHSNGERLAEDAQYLFEMERFPSAYALAVLAQEELAKVLLLNLVQLGALSWTPELRRVLRDHVCKHLASAVLDYLCPEHEEFMARLKQPAGERISLPNHVLDAANLIVHERLNRRDRDFLENDEDSLDPIAKSIADGKLDQRKQNALYVDIGRKGQVASNPSWVTEQIAREEVERAKRIAADTRGYQRDAGPIQGIELAKLVVIFQVLSGAITPEQYAAHWTSR